MGDFKITVNEVLVYFALINIALGLLFGSFPLIAGLKMKKRSYALFGFVGSVIGAAILGALLSYPIAIIFTWLILRNPNETVQSANANSTEVAKENSENR